MSTPKALWSVVSSAILLATAAVGLGQTARLGTFEKDGQEYFALSLLPQVKADPAQKNEVVILVDTSASQVGRFRAEAMAAVQSLLVGLGPQDRVALMAVDMKAVPMNAGLVASGGPE